MRSIFGYLLTFFFLLSVDVHAQKIEVYQGEYIISRISSPTQALRVDSSKFSVIENMPHSNNQLVKSGVQVRGYGKQSITSFDRQIVEIDQNLVNKDCAEILKDKSVQYCEPNYFYRKHATPNDPDFYLQWALNDPTYNYDVDAPQAWDLHTGSDESIVAVLDTGVNYFHEDLAANMWVNPYEIPNNGIDDDQNYYIDDIHGADTFWVDGNPIDYDGHGSHVAGIIGAHGNNGFGISGVNWKTKIIAVNAYDGEHGFESRSIINGINYIYGLKKYAAINVVAVNASFGGSGYSQAQKDAIDKLRSVNIAFVAAAGNDDSNNDYTPVYPAGYDLDNIVSVAATQRNGAVTDFSNYGRGTVDIAAPGKDILSTWTDNIGPDYTSVCKGTGNQIYCILNGTSMATPMVTGALALLYSQRGHLSYQKLFEIMYNYSYYSSYYAQFVRTGRLLTINNMLNAPYHADQCPNDPKKIEPGVCGCGVFDNHRDSDKDGTPNCIDQCVTDSTKTTPGACGCGKPDTDSNGNGVADCNDVNVSTVNVSAPRLVVKKKKLNFYLTPITGLSFLLKIRTTLPAKNGRKSRVKIQYYEVPFSEGYYSPVTPGSTIQFSYFYVLSGTPKLYSAESAVKKVNIRP